MNNNGNGKPKLELLVNIPTKIKLLQDTPATGTSQYGKWYLYNVEFEGCENSFFSPEQVQKFIEDNHLKKGDELEITKTLTKNGKTNVVDFKINLISKQNGQDTKPTNGNGKPDDIKIMRECLISAIELQKELGSVVDVNKIGMSLYIARTKNGNFQF
jgi:hypothetical protein